MIFFFLFWVKIIYISMCQVVNGMWLNKNIGQGLDLENGWPVIFHSSYCSKLQAIALACFPDPPNLHSFYTQVTSVNKCVLSPITFIGYWSQIMILFFDIHALCIRLEMLFFFFFFQIFEIFIKKYILKMLLKI